MNTTTELSSKKAGIYGLQNKLQLDKWNIGQTINPIRRRWAEYRDMRCKKQPKIYKALLEYGYDGFNKVVVETLPENIIDVKEIQSWLNDHETYWIKFYNSVENGYNCKAVGGAHGNHSEETKEKIRLSMTGKKNPFYGKKHSEEARRKIREARSRQVITEEHKMKVATANRGKKRSPEFCKMMSEIASNMSDETKAKISFSKLGKKRTAHSEETKRKIGKALTERWRTKYLPISTAQPIL